MALAKSCVALTCSFPFILSFLPSSTALPYYVVERCRPFFAINLNDVKEILKGAQQTNDDDIYGIFLF